MVEAYQRLFKNYANFNGRSTRSDYWYIFLGNFLVGFVLGLIGGLFSELGGLTDALATIYSLVMLVPGIALVVRRLHDINKSGWFYFIALVPLVGGIILLVFLCTASVNENNRYGERV